MRSRLQALFTPGTSHWFTVEATLVGLFFIQSLRFLVGLLYSRVSGATIVSVLPPEILPTDMPGVIDPALVQSELIFIGVALALPLLTILIGHMRWSLFVTALLVAIGRAFINMDSPPITQLASAGLVVGAGLAYTAVLVRHRFTTLPVMFVLAFGIDQLYRAYGNTMDPSIWQLDYGSVQVILSILLVTMGFLNNFMKTRSESDDAQSTRTRGLLPFWSGFGMGAILFLEMAFLAMPNAVAGRADVDYTFFVGILLAATLLPLIPAVRAQARKIIGMFEGGVRGWIWFLIVALVIVIGSRIQGLIGGGALIVGQFAISMSWWWLARPQAERERNLSGLWIIGAIVVFTLLVVFDFFTYEYAFVRNFAAPLDSLNTIIPPLLRGFRGMGLGVLLIASFLAIIPMLQMTRRIPWTGGSFLMSLFTLIFVITASVGGSVLASPPIIEPDANEFRVGTYNIHGGFNEFYYYDLEAIAQAIENSGSKVVLLQEIEAGRLTSFGIDEPLWLARRLKMDVRFFPTNEGLQGLAVLSKYPILFDEGTLLQSIGSQTGLQRIQILPQPNNSPITIYNTWLGPLLAGESIEDQEREQRQQLNQIFAIMSNNYPDGELGRAIFGGTFHNTPDSPLIQVIERSGFNDPFAGSNLELTATFNRIGRGQARLDYIWIWRENLRAIGTGVRPSKASDHRLAFVGLLLEP